MGHVGRPIPAGPKLGLSPLNFGAEVSTSRSMFLRCPSTHPACAVTRSGPAEGLAPLLPGEAEASRGAQEAST